MISQGFPAQRNRAHSCYATGANKFVEKQRLIKLSFSILHTIDGHENSPQRKLDKPLFSFPFFVCLDKTSKQSKTLFRPINLTDEDNH